MKARTCPLCGSNLTVLVGDSASTAVPSWRSLRVAYKHYCAACRGELVYAPRIPVLLLSFLLLFVAAWFQVELQHWGEAHVSSRLEHFLIVGIGWVLLAAPAIYILTRWGFVLRAPKGHLTTRPRNTF